MTGKRITWLGETDGIIQDDRIKGTAVCTPHFLPICKQFLTRAMFHDHSTLTTAVYESLISMLYDRNRHNMARRNRWDNSGRSNQGHRGVHRGVHTSFPTHLQTVS